MPENGVVTTEKLVYIAPVLTELGSVQTFVLGGAGPEADGDIESAHS